MKTIGTGYQTDAAYLENSLEVEYRRKLWTGKRNFLGFNLYPCSQIMEIGQRGPLKTKHNIGGIAINGTRGQSPILL